MGRCSCSFPSTLFYIALLLCFAGPHHGADRLGNETDHQALMEFKDKISGDPLKVLSSWNRTLHFCRWFGVTCSRRHQRVAALHLNSSKLSGSISPHLGNLSFLRVLDLCNNSFSDEIPRGIWDLGRLEVFRLVNNSLVGTLPSNISCSSKLKILDLIGNHFSGEVPVTFGCLSKLQRLQLSGNRMTGPIPSSLGNLSSLQVLSVAFNSMTGIIPESLGQLKHLSYFYAGVNRFSGPFPRSVLNISNLLELDVGSNWLQGSLKVDFGVSVPNLEAIYLEENHFTGMIPPSIANATSLTLFEAGTNNFTGSLPSDLGKLSNLLTFAVEQNHIGGGDKGDLKFICSLVNATALENLVLSKNNLGGEIPTCIANLSVQLRLFGLEENKLTGLIPSAMGHLINLQWLSLFGNQLSGQIPSSLGNLHNLKELYISKNHLTGNIPSSFGNLKMLNRLTLEKNNLEGSIPPSLGEFDGLIVLDISSNKLNGSIPPQLFNLAPFSIGINLSHNRFSGTIPLEVGNVKTMGQLSISSNLLSGEIPHNLGSCQSLEFLDISGNLLQGSIPASLSSLKGLQLLNLSNNRLSGEIPSILESLKSLNYLDLSHNDLEGVVPSHGIFLNATAISLTANDKLCGGTQELHLPKCSSRKSGKNWKLILLITSLTIGAAFTVFALICCWLLRKKSKYMPSIAEDGSMELSYHSLFKATNGFSSANLIGAGSFGAVYRGLIDGYKTSVAVKVFDLLQHKALKSFTAECNALRSIRHRNLVKILTVCSSIDYQGNDFKALVYELMSNGNLDEWLHQTPEEGDSNERPPKVLSLLQRLNIGIDVASALDYLHHQCETPIVHCDLKPSNVLLDEDMAAHVGDFGLARFLVGVSDGSLHNETSSIGIKGTVGYTAPEYGMGSQISTYGDVYSYGVLLLEMFTGKRPTDAIFQDGLNLHKFAREAFAEGSLMAVVDPSLLCEDQEQAEADADLTRRSRADEFGRIGDSLSSIIQIGIACSSELPRERMFINDIAAQLKSIRDKLLGTGKYRIKQHHRRRVGYAENSG